MPRLQGVSEVELTAHVANNLDTTCYRGFAPLAHLALISQADIFDQEDNPDGLQRDLSPKHASDAYEYAHRKPTPDQPRAFPEVVLNVRDKRMVTVEPITEIAPSDLRLVRLRFPVSSIETSKRIVVSRVDGNHRLYYAAGDDRRDALLEPAPFQIHIGLSTEQERSLFVDINSNQKGLNTSHLAIMQSKLTAEELEIRDHPNRWIATRLAEDPASPWHGLIHLGGSKQGARAQGLSRPVNFTSLQSGVARTLQKSQYIHDITDPEIQYLIIRNYWQAVKLVFAEEWGKPKQFLLLKGVGVWSLSILGGAIIDRCIPRGSVDVSDMARYLSQTRSVFDWDRNSKAERRVAGMSGSRAALIIAGEMSQELSDETGENLIKKLQDDLKGQLSAAH